MARPLETSIKYLKNDHALAVYKASVAGGELIPHEGNYIEHLVTVTDARELNNELDLDRDGFRLVEQSTEVSDFYDDAQLPLYETEVKKTLSQTLSTSEIMIFDHTRRSSSPAVRSARQIREASNVIHNDYSADSGHTRLHDYLNSSHNETNHDLLDRDFAIINIWRSINGTILNHHLAMCNATSIPDANLVPVKREGKERVGELQLMLHDSAHKWYYFSKMAFNEALVFKTFDSRTDGRTRFTPHTSIADPTAPNDAPARESIETRCFVFF